MTWAVGWDIVGRIVVAAVLGAVIGFEREVDDHPAGTRTNMTVALGAALFGAISTTGFTEFVTERSATNVQVGVTRIPSEVVVGIGFLGAGLIFRRGSTVQNLTTAASLWGTAAIGLAAGVGDVGLAVASTVILFVVLSLLSRPNRWLSRRVGHVERRLEIIPAEGVSDAQLRSHLTAAEGARLVHWRAERRDGHVVYVGTLRTPAAVAVDDQLSHLSTSGLVDGLRVD